MARVNLARLRSATTRCYASANRQSRPATYQAVCSKLTTPLDNVDRANRKAEVRAELTKRPDVKRPDIRARGTLLKYRSRIFWIDGRRTRAAAEGATAGKAVPFPSDRPSIVRSSLRFCGCTCPCPARRGERVVQSWSPRYVLELPWRTRSSCPASNLSVNPVACVQSAFVRPLDDTAVIA